MNKLYTVNLSTGAATLSGDMPIWVLRVGGGYSSRISVSDSTVQQTGRWGGVLEFHRLVEPDARAYRKVHF